MGEEKSNVVITEEGALSVKKLTFWEAAMIIVGANIGAGILGLAYSSRGKILEFSHGSTSLFVEWNVDIDERRRLDSVSMPQRSGGS